MTVGRTAVLAFWLAALTAFGVHPAAAAEDDQGPVVVVLDGSGSMWGQIGAEKASKFDQARQILRQSLSTLSPRVQLGLMSFGQRRRADCSDVEVLAAPEAGPPERVLDMVDKLNPKGKGPLSLALRQAANQLPPDKSASILAIHDGPDNCGQDPCAAAAEIAKSHPKTKVFLIGFGLEPGDSKRLQCVGSATGGKTMLAQTAAELGDAVAEAVTLANLERVDPATGAAVPVPKAATPPAPVGAPGLQLSAALTPDGKPLAAPIAWSIAKADKPDAPLKTARARLLAVDLEPGSYIVEGKLGQASAKQTVEVAAGGPTPFKLSLGAGVLNIKATADKTGGTLSDPVVSVTAKDAARPIWMGRDASGQIVVPAGQYSVKVEDGMAVHSADVTIAPGAAADVDPVLGTGRLELSAVAAATGAPITDVTYAIEEDDPDAPQGRREIARSADPAATFTLPAGTYYVSATAGAASQHERIALGSGATVKHVASFNLVPIKVITSAAAGQAIDAPIVLRILSEDGQAREIARAHGASGSFQLPPARYRVEADVLGFNLKALGVIDLTNGRGGNVQLKIEQGEVTVSGSGGLNRHWRIKDANGRTVMHSGRGNANVSQLSPGRYVLLTDADGGRTEHAFEVKSGDKLQLTAGAP